MEAEGDQRRATGSLSIMGFVDRARTLESRLLRYGSKDFGRGAFEFSTAFGHGVYAHSSPASGSGAASVTGSGSAPSNSPKFTSPLSPPATATSAGSPASIHLDSFSSGVGRGASRSPAASNYAQAPLMETRDSVNVVGEIYKAGALIYLYTVLNGHYPSKSFFLPFQHIWLTTGPLARCSRNSGCSSIPHLATQTPSHHILRTRSHPPHILSRLPRGGSPRTFLLP